MKNSKILLGCPIRDREWIIPNYLESIYSLDYPKELISLCWIVNQSCDQSEKLLRDFKRQHQNEYRSIEVINYFGNRKIPTDTRINNTRLDYTYHHLADVRNLLLENIGDNEYLFSVDSDVLVNPNCLKRLLSHQKPIISSLIYNGYLVSPEAPWKYTNCMKYHVDGKIGHITNWFIKNAPTLKENKLIQVDVTGAVYLISRDVIDAGVRYAYDIQGEDIPFCLSASEKGFSLWCDLQAYSNHIMDKKMIKN